MAGLTPGRPRRKPAPRPHPDTAIIDALGGPAVLAPLCEVTASAVRFWRRNGIASGHRLYLRSLAPWLFEAPPPALPPALERTLLAGRLSAACAAPTPPAPGAQDPTP